RTMRIRLLCVLVTLLCAVSAQGVEFSKVLLPIIIQTPVAGAYGSVWTTRFTISNPSATNFFVMGYDPECPYTCVGNGNILPHTTFSPRSFDIDPSIPGLLLNVEKAGVDVLGYELRVQ